MENTGHVRSVNVSERKGTRKSQLRVGKSISTRTMV